MNADTMSKDEFKRFLQGIGQRKIVYLISESGKTTRMSGDDLYDLISRQVAQGPEPKKGKWGNFWKCSICDKQFDIGTKYHMNFCPNCGADMRGEEHEADYRKK